MVAGVDNLRYRLHLWDEEREVFSADMEWEGDTATAEPTDFPRLLAVPTELVCPDGLQ